MKIKVQAVPGPYHWGEDGATIYAEVDGVERIIAAAPLPHWILASGPKSNREVAYEVREATARLLAAAPELLEALEGVMNSPMSTKAIHAAHAAIAKARGES